MITYEWVRDNLTIVFLEGHRVGKIEKGIDGKFRYYPVGHKCGGEPFSTIKECKMSLEED